jgi:uncharacterized protein (TIGR02145 family)
LNYTKGLTFNAYAREANGKMFTSGNGAFAIGSYWCPGVTGSTYSGDQNACNIYGALYTWQTVMMVDGKYTDESKTSSAWDESWVSPYYYTSGELGTEPNADWNNARGGTTVKGGGRGICPMGWHIPTLREWAIMLDSVEGDGTENLFSSISEFSDLMIGADVGLKLKSANTYAADAADPGDGSWRFSSCCVGQDTYGFNLLPTTGRWNASDASFMRGTGSVLWLNAAVPNHAGPHIAVWLGQPGVFLSAGASAGSGRPVRCIVD